MIGQRVSQCLMCNWSFQRKQTLMDVHDWTGKFLLQKVVCVVQYVRFGELYRVFPDAIILGISNKVTGKTTLNPPAETMIGPDDSLVCMYFS